MKHNQPFGLCGDAAAQGWVPVSITGDSLSLPVVDCKLLSGGRRSRGCGLLSTEQQIPEQVSARSTHHHQTVCSQHCIPASGILLLVPLKVLVAPSPLVVVACGARFSALAPVHTGSSCRWYARRWVSYAPVISYSSVHTTGCPYSPCSTSHSCQ